MWNACWRISIFMIALVLLLAIVNLANSALTAPNWGAVILGLIIWVLAILGVAKVTKWTIWPLLVSLWNKIERSL